MKIKEHLAWAIAELKKNEVTEAEKSAEFLMRQVLGVDKARLFMVTNEELKPAEEKKFQHFINRRKKHEPVWYIAGKVEFCGLDLVVNRNVLIPRPETEFLVEEALGMIAENNKPKVVDIGTGSGAIILAMAEKLRFKHQEEVALYASDVSDVALGVAKKNAKKLGLVTAVAFKKGNLLSPWEGQKFDLILANLPYIPHEEIDSLAFDIHYWEPRVALDGGKRGLVIYEEFLKQVRSFMNPKSVIIAEIGHNQGKEFIQLAEKYLPEGKVKIKKDYSANERMAIIKIK